LTRFNFCNKKKKKKKKRRKKCKKEDNWNIFVLLDKKVKQVKKKMEHLQKLFNLDKYEDDVHHFVNLWLVINGYRKSTLLQLRALNLADGSFQDFEKIKSTLEKYFSKQVQVSMFNNDVWVVNRQASIEDDDENNNKEEKKETKTTTTKKVPETEKEMGLWLEYQCAGQAGILLHDDKYTSSTLLYSKSVLKGTKGVALKTEVCSNLEFSDSWSKKSQFLQEKISENLWKDAKVEVEIVFEPGTDSILNWMQNQEWDKIFKHRLTLSNMYKNETFFRIASLAIQEKDSTSMSRNGLLYYQVLLFYRYNPLTHLGITISVDDDELLAQHYVELQNQWIATLSNHPLTFAKKNSFSLGGNVR
jgi:hypothetical protein